MLDYYGSVIKSSEEIDRELIQKFKERCHESYMKKIISDLRKENILNNEYSHSGWMVFHGKPIHDIIINKLIVQKDKNNQKLKFTYCFNQFHKDIDVCRMICDRI